MLYLGSSLDVCFVETLLRDARDDLLDEVHLQYDKVTRMNYALIEVIKELNLVDFRGNARVRMGIPSDVVGYSGNSLSQAWSLAIHDHKDNPDGIIFPSRLNDAVNIAPYDRAIHKLQTRITQPLVKLPEFL